MTWFDYVLIAWLTIGVVATIALVGKPRKPIDHSTAIMTLVINGLIIAGLVLVG